MVKYALFFLHYFPFDDFFLILPMFLVLMLGGRYENPPKAFGFRGRICDAVSVVGCFKG